MKCDHARIEYMRHDGFERSNRKIPAPIGVGYKKLKQKIKTWFVLFSLVFPPGNRCIRDIGIDQLFVQGVRKCPNR